MLVWSALQAQINDGTNRSVVDLPWKSPAYACEMPSQFSGTGVTHN